MASLDTCASTSRRGQRGGSALVGRILVSAPLAILLGRIKLQGEGICEANNSFVTANNCHSLPKMCEALQEDASLQGEWCQPMYLPLALLGVHNQHYISVFLKSLVFLLAEKQCCLQLSKLVHLLSILSMCYL